MIRPKEILTKLEESIGMTGDPVRLRNAIERVLWESFELPLIQAAEKAESIEEVIRDLIAQEEERNPHPRLALLAPSLQFVAGYCYISPYDTPEIAAAKRSRLNIEPLLQEIRKLTFAEFEVFGACVLKELGARQVKVTKHSDDQGIDFYGIFSLGQNSFLPAPFSRLAHEVKLRFVGQAKHYPTRPIGPEFIRELVGSISLARYKVFTTAEEIFDDLELLPFNPLVAMFFTTGKFTSGALELAEKSGVIAKSGEQLAVFLADKGVGMYDDNGVTRFDVRLFRDWLEAK